MYLHIELLKLEIAQFMNDIHLMKDDKMKFKQEMKDQINRLLEQNNKNIDFDKYYISMLNQESNYDQQQLQQYKDQILKQNSFGEYEQYMHDRLLKFPQQQYDFTENQQNQFDYSNYSQLEIAKDLYRALNQLGESQILNFKSIEKLQFQSLNFKFDDYKQDFQVNPQILIIDEIKCISDIFKAHEFYLNKKELIANDIEYLKQILLNNFLLSVMTPSYLDQLETLMNKNELKTRFFFFNRLFIKSLVCNFFSEIHKHMLQFDKYSRFLTVDSLNFLQHYSRQVKDICNQSLPSFVMIQHTKKLLMIKIINLKDNFSISTKCFQSELKKEFDLNWNKLKLRSPNYLIENQYFKTENVKKEFLNDVQEIQQKIINYHHKIMQNLFQI